MPRCYVLPGILGSELFTYLDGDGKIWENRDRLVLGEFDRLELASNGRFPKEPRGQWCYAGRPCSPYYDALLRVLTYYLEPNGYTIIPMGYDWRMRILEEGSKLAFAIERDCSEEDPCSIVAHSQGGLVARAAWWDLAGDGKQGLIRRIVTLGTPHRGSYAPALLWSLQEPILDAIQLVMLGVVGIAGPFGVSPLDHVWSLSELASVTATWPALYELLPVIDQASAVADPLRGEIFDVSNWPSDRNLLGSHLQEAAGAFRSFMLDPLSMPPAEVLTTVAGGGYMTPFKLDSAEEIGSPRAFRFSPEGDQRVMEDSAMVHGAKQLRVVATHQGLLENSWLLAKLPIEVLEIRTPPVPPMPVITSPEILPEQTTGIPFGFLPSCHLND